MLSGASRNSGDFRPIVRIVAAASLISIVGSQAANIGLVALVYALTHHSGGWLAAALVANYGTRLIVAPWAGEIGDRFDRRHVMIASNIAAAAAFTALATARSPLLIVVLGAATALAESPFAPAAGALIGSLVPEKERAWANAFRSMAGSGGMLLGALFGGVLVAAAGSRASFLVNAASFLIAAGVIALVRGSFRATRSDGNGAPRRRLRAGFDTLFSTPALRICAAGMALSLLGTGMVNIAEYPLFVALGGGSTAFGVAVACWGVGELFGARVARRISTAENEKVALVSGLLLSASAIGIAGLVPSVAGAAGVFALGGVGYAIALIAAAGVVQRWSSDEVRGRTIAAYQAAQQSALGISMCAGGALLSVTSPGDVCVIAGGLGICASCLIIRMPPRPTSPRLPPWRRMRSKLGDQSSVSMGMPLLGGTPRLRTAISARDARNAAI